jgi:hypothetical protein
MRVNLTGAAYQARSVVAAAQRQLNLYSEPIPAAEGEPARAALFPTPGLTLLGTVGPGPIRGLWQATNQQLYCVSGSNVYAVNTSTWVGTLLGTITAIRTNPVSMMDNGLQLAIVDGSTNGWQVTLSSNAFAQIVDGTGTFVGADRVDYLDTFFLFNKNATPQFIASDSLALTFDPLFFANKESASDLLASLIVVKREIALVGVRSTEVWYNTGAADFPFAEMPGVFIDRGLHALYSLAGYDNAAYWLSQDHRGKGIVVKMSGYEVTRISTYAIETEIAKFAASTDAVGYTYEIAGHAFYVLSFPTADKTWVYDITTSQPGDARWHELCWIDTNGIEHRHRGNCATAVNSFVVCGDHENGNLYSMNIAEATDNGVPIKRQRAFPHMIDGDNNRLSYSQFIADMEVGTATGTTDGTAPVVSLDWSDNRGASFGNPVNQSFASALDASAGAAGEYLTSVQWQRLGMARDRVFRLTWSSPTSTALLGAFIDVTKAGS